MCFIERLELQGFTLGLFTKFLFQNIHLLENAVLAKCLKHLSETDNQCNINFELLLLSTSLTF